MTVPGRLSEQPDLSPPQRELARMAEDLADVLRQWGGRVWNIGYDLTSEAADIAVDAPDGTTLTVVVRRGKPYVEDCRQGCHDPDCDGPAGHDGPHYQWIPE